MNGKILAGVVPLVSILANASVECYRLSAEEIKPRSVWKTDGEVIAVAFSQDGQTLASGRVVARTALGGRVTYFAGELRLWEVATGKEKLTIKEDPPTDGLCFSRMGRLLLGSPPTAS